MSAENHTVLPSQINQENQFLQLLVEAYKTGAVEGYNVGYHDGAEDGYNAGYEDGVKDTTDHFKPALSDGLRCGSSIAGTEMNKLKK